MCMYWQSGKWYHGHRVKEGHGRFRRNRARQWKLGVYIYRLAPYTFLKPHTQALHWNYPTPYLFSCRVSVQLFDTCTVCRNLLVSFILSRSRNQPSVSNCSWRQQREREKDRETGGGGGGSWSINSLNHCCCMSLNKRKPRNPILGKFEHPRRAGKCFAMVVTSMKPPAAQNSVAKPSKWFRKETHEKLLSAKQKEAGWKIKRRESTQ